MRILYVDDDENILNDTKEILESSDISGERFEVTIHTDFDEAILKLETDDFDLIIVDVYRGNANIETPDLAGIAVLDKVKNTRYIPIIFYTGLVNKVNDFASEVVRIVRKSDGTDVLKSEISDLAKSGLINVRKDILNYADKTIRTFFWDFIGNNWEKLKDKVSADEILLMLVRRLSLLLSKENLSELFPDAKKGNTFVKTLEFYVFPPVSKIFETGDILIKNEKKYVILTPTCEMIQRNDSSVGVDFVLMVEAKPLKDRNEYEKWMKSNSKENTNELKKLMENRKSTLFFLPEFPLMDSQILDFQNLITERYEKLSDYVKIAKLDSPFAEAMLSNFIRQYERVGIPFIDTDKLIESFKKS